MNPELNSVLHQSPVSVWQVLFQLGIAQELPSEIISPEVDQAFALQKPESLFCEVEERN